jgi:hypothetical protein
MLTLACLYYHLYACENIYFFKLLLMADIRDLLIKRVRAVSEMANALSFIESLPDGFNTEVSLKCVCTILYIFTTTIKYNYMRKIKEIAIDIYVMYIRYLLFSVVNSLLIYFLII